MDMYLTGCMEAAGRGSRQRGAMYTKDRAMGREDKRLPDVSRSRDARHLRDCTKKGPLDGFQEKKRLPNERACHYKSAQPNSLDQRGCPSERFARHVTRDKKFAHKRPRPTGCVPSQEGVGPRRGSIPT